MGSAYNPLPSPRALFASIASWVMTLNVGSNRVPAPDVSPYPSSIFINSNLARVLLASYKLTGNQSHLAEGLRWCDSFVAAQVHAATHDGAHTGGWWNTGYDTLYIADTGTAVTALAVCQDLHPKSTYLQALTSFATFVEGGTRETPQCTPVLATHETCSFDGGKNETSDGWVIDDGGKDDGALGDGYYKDRLNEEAYTIATATTGGAFYAEMAAIGPSAGISPARLQRFESIATAAVRWLVQAVQRNGTIPYVITPPTAQPHEYQCISYSAEAFIDVTLRFGMHAAPQMLAKLNATIAYLLAKQGADGALLPDGTPGEVQRSPRAISLLQWWYRHVHADIRVANALERYVGWLQTPSGAKASGLNTLALSTGFIGLALADLIEPWVTFAAPQGGLGERA